jgi:uncharacterized 2Fe-2S/4Fe-4S cluster protein (DUF4445 family)
MKQEEYKIVFQPTGRSVFALRGTTLLEAAARAGLILQTPCGGAGTCGKCRVRIVEGRTRAVCGDPTRAAPIAENGDCRACVTRICGAMVVEIPESSLFESRQKILTGDHGRQAALDPSVAKRPFALKPAARGHAESDARRLCAALDCPAPPPAVLRALPDFSRAGRGFALLRRGVPFGLTAQDGPPFGVALDIGTTTVVATLLDLADGRELGVEADMNGQTSLGDDVVSRITRVREDVRNLDELQGRVRDTINRLIRALVAKAGLAVGDIVDLTAAGNTAMQQLFCGYNPTGLGELPFAPVFERGHAIAAAELGLETHPGAELRIFPQIGGFVGGDTVAAMLAVQIDEQAPPTLLVDIGTNGEIVLAGRGRILTTSVAAGPAFEGARIVQGMRATRGAIEKVLLEDDVMVNTIGNAVPTGLCGSALIDAAAEMLRHGMMDETGRLLTGSDLPAKLSAPLKRRMAETDGQPCLVLAAAGEFGPGAPAVMLRQKDIRELQLAAAAVRAGIAILLRRMAMEAGDLDAILLAGGFGNFIRRSHARRIGLLPAVAGERIRFVGNAASLGAKLALLSVTERDAAERLRDRAEHVDLSLDPEFQNEFGAAMIFPETQDL